MKMCVMQLVCGIACLSVICMAKSTAIHKLHKMKHSQNLSESEDRRCYRPKWFTEPNCKLSAAAHQLRANGKDSSCRAHPQYDCNSIYLAMEGPGEQSTRALPGVCVEGRTSPRMFKSTRKRTTACEFYHVCKKHVDDVIPSTYWEAVSLTNGPCRGASYKSHCAPIIVEIPFLVSKGCDENVGQKRYKLETRNVTQGYTCID